MRLLLAGLLLSGWGCASESPPASITGAVKSTCPSDLPTTNIGSTRRYTQYCVELANGEADCGWTEGETAYIGNTPVPVSCKAVFDDDGYPDSGRPSAALGDSAVARYSAIVWEAARTADELTCRRPRECHGDFTEPPEPMVTCPDGALFPLQQAGRATRWCVELSQGVQECGETTGAWAGVDGLSIRLSCDVAYSDTGYPLVGEPSEAAGHPAIVRYEFSTYRLADGVCWLEESCAQTFTPDMEPVTPDCVVPDCLGVSEAFASGVLELEVSDAAELSLRNVGAHDVCIPQWTLAHPSGTGASLVFGSINPDGIRLAPGDLRTFSETPGADDVFWPLRDDQFPRLSEQYVVRGAHVPANLKGAIQQVQAATDGLWEDAWNAQLDTLSQNPSLSLDRHQASYATKPGTPVVVSLEVINLGQAPSPALVYETIPANTVATGFDPPPTSISAEPDGATTYGFQVYVPARAAHGALDATPPRIQYRLQVEPSGCVGRLEAQRSRVEFSANDGMWVSESDSVVIDCCLE